MATVVITVKFAELTVEMVRSTPHRDCWLLGITSYVFRPGRSRLDTICHGSHFVHITTGDRLMSTHPLQESLDRLPEYLTDARRLYEIAEQQLAELAEARRAAGNPTGGGQPPAAHKSLNRAVVVASVGALEAFCEDLAIRALPYVADASVSKPWFAIAGKHGMVQTPNSDNIAKMFWSYFRYDPRLDWDILITTAWSEIGTGTNWRGTTKRYQGSEAAKALDAMVKVRHGFAHQDRSNAPSSTAGIVSLTPSGNLSLQSHHAFNSMSLVVQAAIQMTHGLTGRLVSPAGPIRWKKSMTDADWERLLRDTPVANIIAARWTHCPW